MEELGRHGKWEKSPRKFKRGGGTGVGIMMRREDHYLGRRVMEMEVQLREAEEMVG